MVGYSERHTSSRSLSTTVGKALPVKMPTVVFWDFHHKALITSNATQYNCRIEELLSFFAKTSSSMTKNLLLRDEKPAGRHSPGATSTSDLFLQIGNLLQSEREYLNPKLKVEHICLRLNTTPHILLKVLKKKGYRNFTHFVNHFRVEEAKRLMASAEHGLYTLEAISGMAGFGTRQAFYNNFEKMAGMKPAHYRRIVQKHSLAIVNSSTAP